MNLKIEPVIFLEGNSSIFETPRFLLHPHLLYADPDPTKNIDPNPARKHYFSFPPFAFILFPLISIFHYFFPWLIGNRLLFPPPPLPRAGGFFSIWHRTYRLMLYLITVSIYGSYLLYLAYCTVLTSYGICHVSYHCEIIERCFLFIFLRWLDELSQERLVPEHVRADDTSLGITSLYHYVPWMLCPKLYVPISWSVRPRFFCSTMVTMSHFF